MIAFLPSSARAIGWDYALIVAAGGQVNNTGKNANLAEIYLQNINAFNLVSNLQTSAGETSLKWRAFEKVLAESGNVSSYQPGDTLKLDVASQEAIVAYSGLLSRETGPFSINAFFARQRTREEQLAAYSRIVQQRAISEGRGGLTLSELTRIQCELEQTKINLRLNAIAATTESDALSAASREAALQIITYRLQRKAADRFPGN